MFEIPDDDLLWSDDFPLDDFINKAETNTADDGTSLQNLSPKIIALDDVDQELLNQENRVHFKTTESSNAFNTDRLGTKNCSYNVAPAEELSNLCKRKFPGPAGVLPPYSPELDKKSCDTSDVMFQLGSTTPVGEPKHAPRQLSWSQGPTDDIFASLQWKALVCDLGEDAQSLLSKFSIRSLLLKANRKLLNRGKIPLIIGVMDSFEMQGSDASFVLRDPSGKMNGALHRDLFKEPSTALQSGSVLILRQVSVISPSSRTHYLNITPANVALIYTVNREAVVSKRPWCTSQSLTPDNTLASKDSEMQLLSQIIEDSEHELADHLGSLHQGIETCSSPLMGSGEFRLNTVFSRGHAPSFSPRTPLALHRHRNNVKTVHPISNTNTSVGAPLFTSVHSLSHSAQTGHCRTTPHFSSNSIDNSRQHVSNRITPAANFNTGCNVAVDQCKSPCIVSAKAGSSTAHLYHKSDIISPITNNFLQISPAADCDAVFQRKPCFDIGKNNENTPSNLNTFRDDFSDTDDEMMLQMCDEALSQTPAEGQNYHNVIGVVDHQRKFRRDSMRNESKSPRIINKAFEDCRNENQRIQCNPGNAVAYKTSSPYSDAGNKYSSAGNSSIYSKNDSSNLSVAETSLNFAVSSKTPNVGKKFYFKRSHPSSQSSQTSLTTKRQMFEIANQIADNSVQSPFNKRPDLSMINSYLMPDMKNSDYFSRNSISAVSTGNSVVTNRPSTVKPYSSISNNASSKPTTPIVQPSVVNFNTATIGGTGMFSDNSVHNKTVIKSNETPGRNSDIQSTQRGFDSSTAHQMFPHWDDDLTDDLILSQLSDDF